MLFSVIISFGLTALVNIVGAQNMSCLPGGAVDTMIDINFDDLNGTTVLSAVPTTYNGFKFNPAWNIVKAGPNIPFIPHTGPNVLVTGPNFNTTTAEFSVAHEGESFNLISLWMIGCFVNPRFFSNDTACLTTFTGTKTNGSVVSFERPVRKTSMEIIQNFPDEGFTNLVSFKMTNRFEVRGYTSGPPAGRFGIDNIIINKVDSTASCIPTYKKFARYVKY